MELVVVVCFLMMYSSATSLDNLTTLDDFFVYRTGYHLDQWARLLWIENKMDAERTTDSLYGPLKLDNSSLPLGKVKVREFLQFLNFLSFEMVSQFSMDLHNITDQLIYEDFNAQCFGDLQILISDLTVELGNLTCVHTSLAKFLIPRSQEAIDVAVHKSCRRCIQEQMSICLVENLNCTLDYGEGVQRLMRIIIEDLEEEGIPGRSPLDIIRRFVISFTELVSFPYNTAYRSFSGVIKLISSAASVEPFALENLLNPFINRILSESWVKSENYTMFQDELTWEMVKSNKSTVVDLPCSNFRQVYSNKSEQYSKVYSLCLFLSMINLKGEFMRCVNGDSTSQPLTWSKTSSFYAQSQCLCVVSTGNDCGVEAPQGGDTRSYCLSVLLTDLQRQVWHRSADYYSEKLVSVSYETDGRLPVITVLKIMEGVVRGITLITHLACAWRNVPMQVLIFYQSFALLILIQKDVDFNFGLDILSSTLLTGHLHAYKVLIMALRPPDSLKRRVAWWFFLRYIILGIAGTLVHILALHHIGKIIGHHDHLEKLIYFLFHYVILMGNLYMFIKVCMFYYAFKREMYKDVGTLTVVAGLFSNTKKAFVLSAFEITSRIFFLHILDVADVTIFYNFSRTFHGFLLFALFVCSREDRTSTQNTDQDIKTSEIDFPDFPDQEDPNTSELEHVPDQEDPHDEEVFIDVAMDLLSSTFDSEGSDS